MSLTREQIKIAEDVITDNFSVHGNEVYFDMVTIPVGKMVEIFDLFLSRIREEQEVYGWHLTSHIMTNFSRHKQTADKYENIPLFTIPPAAPDCNQIVSAFLGDEIPSFRQGAPSHELEYVVTAEDCSRWINELVELRAACKELVEALELIRKGDDSPRTLAMVALAKHKASMGEE